MEKCGIKHGLNCRKKGLIARVFGLSMAGKYTRALSGRKKFTLMETPYQHFVRGFGLDTIENFEFPPKQTRLLVKLISTGPRERFKGELLARYWLVTLAIAPRTKRSSSPASILSALQRTLQAVDAFFMLPALRGTFRG